jgi:hypothetical protein
MGKVEFDFEAAEKEALKICEECRYHKIRDGKHFCGRTYLVITDIVYYSTGDNPAPPECKKLMNNINKNNLFKAVNSGGTNNG